jgi:hypothetical protein
MSMERGAQGSTPPPGLSTRLRIKGSRKEGIVDSTTLIVGLVVFFVAIGVVYQVGYRRMQREKAVVVTAAQAIGEIPHAAFLGRVAYHGGFPAISQSTYLFLGLVDDGLVLYDGKNPPVRTPSRTWLDLNQFTTLQKAHGAAKSMVLLGPLLPFSNKDKTRHFITIKHTDVDGDENNIVFEAADKISQLDIYDKIKAVFATRNKH